MGSLVGCPADDDPVSTADTTAVGEDATADDDNGTPEDLPPAQLELPDPDVGPGGCNMDCSTLGDACSTFVCSETSGACEGTPADCDDGVDCTLDDCESEAGCVNVPDDAACSDDEPCTTDTCGPAGCEVANNTAQCDDGDLCTAGDACSEGGCAGQPMVCADSGDPCEVAGCVSQTGACVLAPAADGTSCDDGLVCSVAETCSGGACIAEAEADCHCVKDDDCVDDGNACNGAPECDLASNTCAVKAGTVVACDSAGACKASVCNPASGICETTDLSNSTLCSDNSSCTLDDHCQDGACTGTPTACDDGDPCTSGACTDGACVQTPTDAACDDDDPCTDTDTCAMGTCAGVLKDCSGLTDDCHTGSCELGGCVAESTGACDSMDELPPESKGIFDALVNGMYKDWKSEAAPHPSAGPHGTVQVYFNSIIVDSYTANNEAHPKGSSIVKELYSGTKLTGWAVMVKVADGSQGGEGWFWYENFSITSNKPIVSSTTTFCDGCHTPGVDYVLIPYPFE